jgi:hypothetical protein
VPIGIAIALFSTASVYAAITSTEFLEADGITHYLYARFAFAEPHYLLNVWGRPLCTGLYALPALLAGRLGVRLTSLALALVCAVTAHAIARGQRYRWPALALIFTLAQPLVFLHSFSELTELPFAALIGLAFLAYQRQHLTWMALLIGLSPLGRPEGFGFILLAAAALVLHRRFALLPLLVLPILAWELIGWGCFGAVTYTPNLPWALQFLLWLPRNWPYAGDSVYGSGYLLKYVALLPAVASPLIFPATCIGIGRSLRPKFLDCFWNDHRERCQVLIAVLPLLILIAHSLLHWLGKMASSGEIRYMLVVAPFWALLSAQGWEFIFERFRWRPVYIAAGIASLLPVIVNQKPYLAGRVLGYRVVPLQLSEGFKRARAAAEWYRTWPLRDRYPYIMVAHPGVFYFLDISQNDKQHTRYWNQTNAANPPPGTVCIWDPIYSVYNADASKSVTAESMENASWLRLDDATDQINAAGENTETGGRWQVWISPEPIK